MAEQQPPQSPATLAPPGVTALKEAAVQDAQSKGPMIRTISMDIREEREELKRAAEQSLNAILELGLDGSVKWVSPTWQDLTGTPSVDILGKNISDIVVGDEKVFTNCVEALREDDSKSRVIRFAVRNAFEAKNEEAASSNEMTPADGKPSLSTSLPSSEIPLPAPTEEGDKQTDLEQSLDAKKEEQHEGTIAMEAQGIMVYDRANGNELHTMWMIKPAVSREITIDLPEFLVESLGYGSEMLANYLTLLTDVGLQNPGAHPPPLPVMCRICERQITPWWFEKHTELCAQDHRTEMQVQLATENLNEQRSALVKVLDALEAQQRLAKPISGGSDSGSPSPLPRPEYKGMPIGTNSNPSSNPSSGRASPAAHTPRSRDSSSSGLSHHRARSFAVRRPLSRIVELVLDLCDTAMEISTPSVKDSKGCAPGEIRTQSPQSESRIQQVLGWQSPSATTLESEQGLATLCDDTYRLAKAKIDAVFRHRSILDYSERIRMENEMLVSECIEAAIEKAARIKSGDLSDSGDDSSYETPDQEPGPQPKDDTVKPPSEPSQEDESAAPEMHRLSGIPSSMAIALRNMSDPALDRRTSSAGSSRASSPRGAKTPKSNIAPTEQLMFQKRHSLAFESDTGADSDSSMHSSIASLGPRRIESPSGDQSLGRVASHRSRERKRQSLVLPSLAATTSNRHQSPGRGPPPPGSPLRMAKPRLPSNADSLPSPITSPVLSHSEFPSPVVRPQHKNHHRRQSSAALADMMGRPASPRLTAVGNTQPRAVQTSIKDFEIIKPISKGAFGSVYLCKKRSTGDYYAVKALKKADMVAKNQVTNVKAERAIMMIQGESDFVAKLYWTFSSKDYLYLVMEYLNGGDCASLIKVLGALPEDWTKKYIGEVVLCVQHLHNRQIVHRDLKPDNFLIDARGHLKLTDFGLSRMGLIGRQKRAMNAEPEDVLPDLLKSGPFKREPSIASSRSTSFDFHGAQHSPMQTPAVLSSYGSDLNQPSYFSLARESSTSRDPSRRTSAHRSDSGEGDALAAAMFRRFSIADTRTPIEEENPSENGSEPLDPYALTTVASNSSAPRTDTPPQSSIMPPPAMTLFDPEDSNRRFVGTPDYLAPETINGYGQDESSDWWSLGCILFECLYGMPPFNADTPEKVFQNILARDIQWPSDDDEVVVSNEAKDLINKLICLDPKERLGSNKNDAYADGGEEIKAHPWFADINLDTLREEEASFIPNNDNPEDTEYFDARGATMQNFAAEFDDQQSSPGITPAAEYLERPHDALSRVRSQVNAVKRNLMPLHIPPHVRDSRSRRLSEPVVADDFGSFQFKNLPVLEKANKDVIQKLRSETLQAQAKSGQSTNASSSVASPSPAPSLESSPILPMPLKRALSQTRGNNRPQSPSLLSQAESSPSRGSGPSSPLLVSFSAGQNHERRKASSGSSNLSQQTSNPTHHASSLQPGPFFEQAPRLPMSFKTPSNTPSPIKGVKMGSVSLPLAGDNAAILSPQSNATSPRQRSHTVGSQDGDLVPELMPTHYKRRSGMFDVSPSSSDTEDRQAKLRVHRRRASSRRMSQISLSDGPTFRTLDVLVCEDHPVSRLVMERLLEKLRCRTISVTNGSEAIRYAMSEVKFDIIMMEYKLPHLNGADIARMIRDTKNANSHTPIVAVTGYLKELQAPHHFDGLIEKPPTKEKLEEVIGRLCQWKAAPDGWRPSLPQPIPHSNLRQESLPTDDSPTTTTSSGFGGFGTALSSSYIGSSRGDSIGSSQLSSLGDADSHFDSIPVIISRQATSEFDTADLERNFGGLGITNTVTAEPKSDKHMSHPTAFLTEQASAPPILSTQDWPVPRKQPSMEAIEAKRRSLEKTRNESAAESGDDEDEELGNIQTRTRSPKRNVKRSSRLGIEMMRTNSQGSVISAEDMAPTSNEIVAASEHQIVGGLADTTILEESAAEVEAVGKLTPPTIFSLQSGGDHTEVVGMDATAVVADPHATPRPVQTGPELLDPDPTPRASGSPQHVD